LRRGAQEKRQRGGKADWLSHGTMYGTLRRRFQVLVVVLATIVARRRTAYS
jgi:hypothetical protein